MYFLFSGEGSTDCGVCLFDDRVCAGENFHAGPMVYLANQLVESADRYSPLDTQCCALVKRSALKKVISDWRATGKRMSLPGRGRGKETLSYLRSAQALARWARQWAAEQEDDVVAIYFRDSDARNKTPVGDWKEKYDAALRGFRIESYTRGVPMIPQPTSEAWFICALKERPYEQCQRLEKRSGSPNAKKPLKRELEELLGEKPARKTLCALVQDGRINASSVDMPSFNAFRERLLEVLRYKAPDG